MKAVFGILLRPKVVVTAIFFLTLILAFQNCQQGGSGFNSLRSTCVTNCDATTSATNPELIRVDIADSGGYLNIQKSDNTLTVFGSCNRGGYPGASITVRLSRSSAPNPTKLLSSSCSSGAWQVVFNGIQDYSPNTNPTDLTLDASIVAEDANGDEVYPLIASYGHEVIAVKFASDTPGATPSPSPGTGQTLSIIGAGRQTSDSKKLTIYAYLYPSGPVPSSMKIDFTNLSNNPATSGTKGPFPFPPFYADSLVSVDIRPGIDDITVQGNGDSAAKSYRISLSVPGTNLQDNNFTYQPLPANVSQQINKNSSSFCYFTADTAGHQARSIGIPLVFDLGNTEPQVFTLNYEFRNLGTGSDWRARTQQISVNSANVGEIKLNSDSTEPDPQRQLLLFRIYYKQTVLAVVTDGRYKSSNGSCN